MKYNSNPDIRKPNAEHTATNSHFVPAYYNFVTYVTPSYYGKFDSSPSPDQRVSPVSSQFTTTSHNYLLANDMQEQRHTLASILFHLHHTQG